jgi:hypothetical protein
VSETYNTECSTATSPLRRQTVEIKVDMDEIRKIMEGFLLSFKEMFDNFVKMVNSKEMREALFQISAQQHISVSGPDEDEDDDEGYDGDTFGVGDLVTVLSGPRTTLASTDDEVFGNPKWTGRYAGRSGRIIRVIGPNHLCVVDLGEDCIATFSQSTLRKKVGPVFGKLPLYDAIERRIAESSIVAANDRIRAAYDKPMPNVGMLQALADADQCKCNIAVTGCVCGVFAREKEKAAKQ